MDLPARLPVVAAPTAAGVPTPRRVGHRGTAWSLLAAPVAGRRVPGTLVLTAAAGIVSLLALIFGAASWRLAGLVAASVPLYRVGARLGLGRAGRVGTVLASAVLLSASSTPSSPRAALLMVGTAACAAGVAHAVTSRRTFSGGELAVFCGLPAAGAAWAARPGAVVPLLAALVVVAGTLARRRPVRRALVSALGVTAVPALLVGWWWAHTGTWPAMMTAAPVAGVLGAVTVALGLRAARR